MSFEIHSITNNNRNSGKTQTRNGILFHVKITTETEEVKYVEFTIEKILKTSVSLRCPKKCPARVSAKHSFDTVEIGMSGKNKLFDFNENITSEHLKCTSNWSLYHRVGSKCSVTLGLCQHVSHAPECTYTYSRDVLRLLTTDAVHLKITGNSPSFTDISKSLKNRFAPSKTLTGEEIPATKLKDHGVNLDKIGQRLRKYRPDKTVPISFTLPDELKTLAISTNMTDYWTFEYDQFIINVLPSELSRLQGQQWLIDGTFSCFSRIRDFYQMFIISVMYESADLKRCFGYPVVFVSMKTKTQLDYEDVFKSLNQINLFYNYENLTPASLSSDYELGIIKACDNVFPGIPQLRCWFHFNQTQTGHIKKIWGNNFKRDPLGNYVSKIVSATVFIDWTEELISEFFDHLEILSLEIECETKRLTYYNYIDYLREYYFSNHCWTNIGNNFATFASNGIRNFTNNTSEGINRAFKEEFKSAPNNLENVLIRVKEFKKKYILQKADKMGDDRMRLRPKAQIRRAERRENLIRTFHNLQPAEKLIQLLDTLKAIGFA